MSIALVFALILAACGSDDEGRQAESRPTNDPPTTVAATPTSAAAVSQATGGVTVAKASNVQFGTILVDSAGLTLYTFDRDTRDDGYGASATSACSGSCAETWPPLRVPAGTVLPTGGPGVTGLSTLHRDDGGVQVTVNGKALYRYAGDSRPGDTNGEGIGGVWHVAKG